MTVSDTAADCSRMLDACWVVPARISVAVLASDCTVLLIGRVMLREINRPPMQTPTNAMIVPNRMTLKCKVKVSLSEGRRQLAQLVAFFAADLRDDTPRFVHVGLAGAGAHDRHGRIQALGPAQLHGCAQFIQLALQWTVCSR